MTTCSDTATILPRMIRIPRLIEGPVMFLDTIINDTKVIKKNNPAINGRNVMTWTNFAGSHYPDHVT